MCQGLSHLDLELFLLDGILPLDSEIFLGILSRTVIFQLEISSLLLLDQELLLQHYLLELSALVLDLDLELIEFIVQLHRLSSLLQSPSWILQCGQMLIYSDASQASFLLGHLSDGLLLALDSLTGQNVFPMLVDFDEVAESSVHQQALYRVLYDSDFSLICFRCF